MNIYYTSIMVSILLILASFIFKPQDYEEWTADGHVPETELREFFNVSPDGNLSPYMLDRNLTENFYYEHYKDCPLCKEKVLKMNNYWHDRYDGTSSSGNMYTSPLKSTLHRHRSGL